MKKGQHGKNAPLTPGTVAYPACQALKEQDSGTGGRAALKREKTVYQPENVMQLPVM
ncbi:hypothetical protein V2T44_22775 [Serratia ficaria]|uniref:hypothetical protein n=1 Tax=Serratia TaxID=613 RepID=UPI0012EDB138|nr:MULTISPECIES: hypothetical protein [Serratia]MEE4485765.1 hypothetical protein [Serratia ficaria]